MKILLVCSILAVSQVLCSKTWYYQYALPQDGEVASPPTDSGDDLAVLAGKLGLRFLLKALTEAGLADTIKSGGPFTVFAPSDRAFHKLPRKLKLVLMRNKTLLADLLKYHVVSGKVFSSQLSNEMVADSLLNVEGKALGIRINIYQGGKVITASGSQIVKVDQNATNGVIHIIDRVMYPVPVANIVGTLSMIKSYNKEFATLITAVQTAGLVDTLGGGPYTLFAPTNRAFERLPEGALEKLLKNKTALTDILTYHVVDGTFFSAGLTSGSVPTLEGKDVEISAGRYHVKVNDASVVVPDIAVTNGVIHVIDRVLLPPTVHFKLVYGPLMFQSSSNLDDWL